MTWYLVVAVVIGAGGYLLRRHLVSGPAGLDPFRLTGVEVGYLTGGPRRAVAAVLTGLRVADAITFTDGRVVQGGPAPRDWGRLGPVVRIVAPGRTGVAGLIHHRFVAADLDKVRRKLEAEGWLRTRPVRWIAVPMWVLVGVGLVGTVLDDGRRGWWIVTTLAVGYAAFALGTAPELTTNARRALAHLTEEHRHLSPDARPSLVTYGPAAAAVAVGLYGTTVLLSLDPGLALAADMVRLDAVARPDREAAGSGGGGGGGGCGSGGSDAGSCSGGSCSSSCGGGCGGGGCGGCGG